MRSSLGNHILNFGLRQLRLAMRFSICVDLRHTSIDSFYSIVSIYFDLSVVCPVSAQTVTDVFNLPFESWNVDKPYPEIFIRVEENIVPQG